MIWVNCARFNMVAADAQSPELGNGGLWALHTLVLNVWAGFEHLQVRVLTCHLVLCPNFDSCLQIIYAVRTHQIYFQLSWVSSK